MPKIENPGRYPATVTSAEFGESGTGTPYFNLFFNTESGSIGAWLYLSDKALPYTIKTLREAFNFDGDFDTAVEQVKGKQCSITTDIEDDDKGVEKMRVKFINAHREVKPIANQDSFLKALSAKAARIPKAAPKAGTAPAVKANPAKAAKTIDTPFG